MRYRFLVCLSLLVTFTTVSYAQGNYSIPVDSWIYPAIEQLQTRGYLLDLSPGFKPYRRMEVAKALWHLVKKTAVSRLPKTDRWLIRKLEQEFSYEMKLVGVTSANPDTCLTSARIGEEDFLSVAKGDYQTFNYATKPEFRPTLRTEFGLTVGNRLLLYTDATIDQTLKDDSLYMGSTKFGLDALTQQGYIEYSSKYFDFTFGRDYLSWGYGDAGKVFVSATPGAFHMASLLVKTNTVKFNGFVAQLNPMNYNPYDTYPPDSAKLGYSQSANRFLTGSRIELNLSNKVFLGAYQGALFGGPDWGVNLDLINPLRVVYETEINDHLDQNTNAFIGADLSVFFPKGVNFYGDLLIDDWMVDHKVVSDLEPNKYAFNLGVKLADPLHSLGMWGPDIHLEFLMVGNRVYNEYNYISYQKLMLNNYPVAAPYGDNFWEMDLRLNQWVNSQLQVSLETTHIERGSSTLYGPYNMPWLDNPAITVRTGYKEPFPYGIIEETNLAKVGFQYQPSARFYASIDFTYSKSRNFAFISGANNYQPSFLVTIYYNFAHTFSF